MMKKIFLLLLLAGLGVGGFFAWRAYSGPADSISYLTETVRTGNLRKTVNATGQISASELVSVGAQVSGQIKKIHVILGQEVKKGDPIAEIDSTTQTDELNTSKAKLKTYQAQLEAKSIAYKVAQTKYNREVQLRRKDSTSRENLETAENTLAAAKAAVTEQESLIRQQEIAVNTAETKLGYTRIVAPRDGTIVSIPVKEGQTVNANQNTPTIVQVADLSEMEIKIEIAEGDITLIQPGFQVEYTILSDPGATRHATLHSIDPGLTTLSNGSYESASESSSNSAVYYYARALAPNPDRLLRIGMTTQNVILVARADNVLLLPSLVIQQERGHNYVRVLLPNGQVERRQVQVGLNDAMHTEIVSGLSEGEKVIASQMSKAEAKASTGMPGGRTPRI